MYIDICLNDAAGNFRVPGGESLCEKILGEHTAPVPKTSEELITLKLVQDLFLPGLLSSAYNSAAEDLRTGGGWVT